MSAPAWARALVRAAAPPHQADDAVGDLEEAHAARRRERGSAVAHLLTGVEALDVASALLRERMRRRGRTASPGRSGAGGAGGGGVRHGPRGGGVGISWLDAKLAFRMLFKYPGLTAIGGMSIAFAIWVGASFFELVSQTIDPELPLVEGERVVGITMIDQEAASGTLATAQDFARWRGQLETVTELGAFRTVERNLTVPGQASEPELVAEMTASAFRLARVEPLLGRGLVEEDERPGGPPVVVLGYELWQSRFDADPGVVGEVVQLGGVPTTVVGVMPEGFGWPISHPLWTPLTLDLGAYGPREGPTLRVVGRLAEGVSLARAESEVQALGLRAAADQPETHRHLRTELLPYARTIFRMPDFARLGLASTNLFLVMLLVLVCGNVALLMFARAATRESEIVVRNALGAGRRRIVLQLFTEALALGALGAAVGLSAAGYGIRWAMSVVESQLLEQRFGGIPFWFEDSLSPATLVYTVALTALGAVIAGVVPALKITGKGIESRLRESANKGRTVRFGGLWTAVIVSQVAVTVAFPATAWFLRRDLTQLRTYDFGFPAEQFLSARVDLDQLPPGDGEPESPAELRARFAETVRRIEERLAAEPGVLGATFTDQLPGSYHPWYQIEVEEGAVAPPDERGHRIGRAHVAPDYFATFDARAVSGRGFDAGDLAPDARVVVVNESFVQEVLGGANPIGRHIRYVAGDYDDVDASEPAPWYEIVGVVPQLGVQNGYGSKGVYHPVAPEAIYPGFLALRVTGDPREFAPRLREVAAAVDPSLRLAEIRPVSEARQDDIVFYAFWYRLTLIMSGVALVLALAGIYAVMAFTVARRTREIGIRVALGSDARSVVLSIFRRPLAQIVLGVTIGIGYVSVLEWGIDGITWQGAAMLVGYALLMVGVCMLSCVVPTRRALRVQPTEALRYE